MEPSLFLIRALAGIIFGLSLTQILKNIIKPLQHPALKYRNYWVHSLWAVYLFLLQLQFWWWEFKIDPAHQWNFARYVYLIVYALLFFALSYLLYPDDISEYESYKEYFYSRKNWFFSLLAASYVLDVAETLQEGLVHLQRLGTEYMVRNCIHMLLCLLAMKIRNKRFHSILVILFILYELSWITRWFVNQ